MTGLAETRNVPLGTVPRLFLASEALGELTLARMATVLPERWYFRLYGLTPQTDERCSADTALQPRVALIGRAVARVANIVPFRAVCLQQALATRRMLRRRGVAAEIVFGLLSDADGSQPGDVVAHAWVEVSGLTANGWRQDLARFAVVGRYL